MHRAFELRALGCAIAMLVAACSGDRGPPAPATGGPDATEPTAVAPGTTATAPAPPSSAAPEEAPPPLAFTCEGGARVDIGPLAATLQPGGGRRVQLARDPDNAFHFRGGATEFRMRGTGGELVHDGARFACRTG